MSNIREQIESRVASISIDDSDLLVLSELVEGQLEEIAGGFSSHGQHSQHGQNRAILISV